MAFVEAYGWVGEAPEIAQDDLVFPPARFFACLKSADNCGLKNRNKRLNPLFRGLAQSGSAPGLGPGGRKFNLAAPTKFFQ